MYLPRNTEHDAFKNRYYRIYLVDIDFRGGYLDLGGGVVVTGGSPKRLWRGEGVYRNLHPKNLGGHWRTPHRLSKIILLVL